MPTSQGSYWHSSLLDLICHSFSITLQYYQLIRVFSKPHTWSTSGKGLPFCDVQKKGPNDLTPKADSWWQMLTGSSAGAVAQRFQFSSIWPYLGFLAAAAEAQAGEFKEDRLWGGVPLQLMSNMLLLLRTSPLCSSIHLWCWHNVTMHNWGAITAFGCSHIFFWGHQNTSKIRDVLKC